MDARQFERLGDLQQRKEGLVGQLVLLTELDRTAAALDGASSPAELIRKGHKVPWYHFAPRVEHGRWYYSRRNAIGQTQKVGLCASERECHGHGTPEAARMHFRETLLRTRMQQHRVVGMIRQCRVCLVLTAYLVDVDGCWTFWLCDQHRNAEVVAMLMPDPGSMLRLE